MRPWRLPLPTIFFLGNIWRNSCSPVKTLPWLHPSGTLSHMLHSLPRLCTRSTRQHLLFTHTSPHQPSATTRGPWTPGLCAPCVLCTRCPVQSALSFVGCVLPMQPVSSKLYPTTGIFSRPLEAKIRTLRDPVRHLGRYLQEDTQFPPTLEKVQVPSADLTRVSQRKGEFLSCRISHRASRSESGIWDVWGKRPPGPLYIIRHQISKQETLPPCHSFGFLFCVCFPNNDDATPEMGVYQRSRTTASEPRLEGTVAGVLGQRTRTLTASSQAPLSGPPRDWPLRGDSSTCSVKKPVGHPPGADVLKFKSHWPGLRYSSSGRGQWPSAS